MKALLSLFAVGLVSCTAPDNFKTAMMLGGKKIPAQTLNEGKEAYQLYCRSCHGDNGNGEGPASAYLRPSPRDLRMGTYKFLGVQDGLPHDEDFVRIIKNGLTGTAMLPWDVPEAEILPIIHYIKTFLKEGEGFRDPDVEIGQRVTPTVDTWQNKEEAVQRGKVIYHAKAMCGSCHPAYATQEEIFTMSTQLVKEGMRNDVIKDFRDAMFLPEAKESGYTVGGIKQRILPPDFTFNEIRTLAVRHPEQDLENLYRVIGAGIPGTAMPAWKGAMPEQEIWALVHYVKSLVGMKNKPELVAFKQKLQTAAPLNAQSGTGGGSVADKSPNKK